MKKISPPWLKARLRIGNEFQAIERIIEKLSLNTICREAFCPNISECFNHQTVTFLILGDRCTRECSFCGVKKGNPLLPDPCEPKRIAQAVRDMGLAHTVITSVTRDDLPDGGAAAFARTIREIKMLKSESVVEVLIPDLNGSKESLFAILNASPQILGHNLETAPRLYPLVRRGSDYKRSLKVLEMSKKFFPSVATKSSLILGLGEKKMRFWR